MNRHEQIEVFCRKAAREINRTFIVTRLTKHALDQQHGRYQKRKRPRIRIELPDVAGGVHKVRAEKILIEGLLKKSLDYDIYKHSLISAVSVIESFLGHVLRFVLQSFPERLLGSDGEKQDKQVKLEAVVRATDIQTLRNSLIEDRIVAVFYAAPKRYFQQFTTITGFKLTQPVQDAYIEIKATRDVLIHNFGVVNSIYLQKAGKLSRAALNQELLLSADYFRDALTTLKKIIAEVWDNSGRIFRSKKD